MSVKSESIDLNTDVVLSDPENEAVAEKSRLSGQNDVALGGGSSSVGEKKEVSEVRVLERVNEAEEEKFEGLSMKETVEEDKGSVLEGRDCVVTAVLGSDGLVENEKMKEDSLAAEEDKEGFAKKEGNAVEDSGANPAETSCSLSLEVEQGKEDLAEERRVTVEDSGSKLEEASRSQSLEAEKEKEDFPKKGRIAVEDLGAKVDETSCLMSVDAEKDKIELAEKEKNVVDNAGGKLEEMSRSQCLGAEKDNLDLAKEEINAVEGLGTKLDEPSCLQSPEAENDKVNSAETKKESVKDLGAKLGKTSCSKRLEAEKDKEDLAEKERKTVEDSGVKVDDVGHSQNLEARKDKKDFSPKERDAIKDVGIKPDVISHSQNVSEILQPKSVKATESSRKSADAVPVVEGETKADPDESFPEKDPEVIGVCEAVDSAGLQHGTLEVNLEAEPKGKGGSRIVKPKSVPAKPGFSYGDLIWGKVRSHPWWPGQVCDPSAASRKAKKYFKKDTFLIAYYGDNSFAWNEASRIKPFLEHFSQLENQSNSEDFHYAMDCVLEEVSRRVEFSLSCPCLDEEVYEQIGSQIIVNAGIREDSSRIEGGDSSLTTACFKPDKLVKYIKELAQNPKGNIDGKLEFAVAQSELLAFSRWKGYSCLPEFTVLGGILESDAEMVQPSKEKTSDEATEAVNTHSDKDELVSEKEKSNLRSSATKHRLDSLDSAFPSKKKKSLSDLMVEKSPKSPVGENGQGSKVRGKKRKASDVVSANSLVKETKTMATVVDDKPLPSKQSFRVGDRISRVASQLNGSSPILKNGNGKSKSSQPHNSKKEGTLTEELKPKKPVEKRRSPDEMSSKLSSDVKSPTGVNNLSSDDEDNQSLEDLFGGKSIKNRRKSRRPVITELPHRLGPTSESYWSERIGKSIPEDQDETLEMESSGDLELDSDSKQKTSDGNLETESEKKPVDHSDGLSKDESFPTALILKFTDSDSVPSKTNLNKIFGSYKSLDKSKTEVLKNNRAQVVFKKRADAETAFSSSGKYSTFGPALVSYRLKFLSSSSTTPSKKASPKSKLPPKSKKNDKASEGNKAK